MKQNYLKISSDLVSPPPIPTKMKQNALYKLSYNVDIVFCIDATDSMKPILDTVKNNALNFYSDLIQKMEAKKKTIQDVRIKVIAFRDFNHDMKDALEMSDFFKMPMQENAFESFVKKIEPKGGGDIPEDGLEA